MSLFLFTLPSSANNEDDEPIEIIEEFTPKREKNSALLKNKADDEPIIIDDDDDDRLIIDDDDDDMLIIDDDDDDTLLIIDEDSTEEEPDLTQVQGALGRLYEAFHIGMNWRLNLSGQTAPFQDAAFRSRADVNVESWLLAAPNLSLYADAFVRIGVDASNDLILWAPVVDVNEVYAKINFGLGSVLLGRLIVPWGRTQVAALGDRLNPSDLRRGNFFPTTGRGLQPQWGAVAKTSLGNLSIAGVVFATHEATEGSLAASDQGGFRTGRYQQALMRRPLLDDTGTRNLQRAKFLKPLPLQDSLTLGLRVWRRIGDFDLGASVVWGVDDTPGLSLSTGTALSLSSALQNSSSLSSIRTKSCVLETEGCLAANSLQVERTSSLVLHAEWGLGLVILKSALLIQPKIQSLLPTLAPGKTVYLQSERGVYSSKLSHYGAVIAAEAGLFEWVTGSIELFNRLYIDIPQGSRLLGVELLSSNISKKRWVNRLALGASLKGSFFEETLLWQMHGEVGILQPDISGMTEVRYRLPLLSLYIGSRIHLFTGMPGAPGWMRQSNSGINLFIGQGP